MTFFNLLDMISTWYCMPDLYFEANPIVAKYKLGWPGLLTVVFLWQGFYTVIVWFRCYKFTPRDYSAKKNNRFIHLLGIYFSGSTLSMKKWKWKEWKESSYALLNYLGFYFPIIYCSSKLLISISNFNLGIVIRHSKVEYLPNGWATFHINTDNFLYTSKFGRRMAEFADLSFEAFDKFHSLSLTACGLIILIYFVRKEWKRARSFPIGSPEGKEAAESHLTVV
jgi:hypothetical protein